MSETTVAAPEKILVVPAAMRKEYLIEPGFHYSTRRNLSHMLLDSRATFLPRGDELENDESWLQIIPYMIILHNTMKEDQPMRVFSYWRTKKAGESRLRGKRSIGIGGHINTGDGASPVLALENGLKRELYEEVNIEECTPMFQGFLYDDSNPVGRVHLGAVYHIELTKGYAVQSKDEELTDGSLHEVKELLEDIDSFETWSQIMLKAM